MERLTIGNYEIDEEAIAIGAAIGIGAGLIGIGMRHLYAANRIRKVLETPISEEDEYEEFLDYVERKDKRIARRRTRRIRLGVACSAVGAAAVAAGVVALSPAREYIAESTPVRKIREVDIDDLKGKISLDDLKTLKDKIDLEELKDKIIIIRK